MNDFIDSISGKPGYSRSSGLSPQNYQNGLPGANELSFDGSSNAPDAPTGSRSEIIQGVSDSFDVTPESDTTHISLGGTGNSFKYEDSFDLGGSTHNLANFGNSLSQQRYHQNDMHSSGLNSKSQLGLGIGLRKNPAFSEGQEISSDFRSMSSANLHTGFIDLQGGYSNLLQTQKLHREASNDFNRDFVSGNNFLGFNRAHNTFPSQPPSPVKPVSMMATNQLDLSSRNPSYLRSVPATGKNSPEINQIWDSLESLSINKTKEKMMNNTKNSKLSGLDSLNSLSKTSSISPSENLGYNEPLSQDVYLSLNRFSSNDTRRGISAPLNSYNDNFDYQNSNTAEYDPHLPSGLLDDDEGLYFTKNKSPSALDNSSRNPDMLGYKPSNYAKLHDQGFIQNKNYDVNYNEFQDLSHYTQQGLSDFANISSRINQQHVIDQSANVDLGLELGPDTSYEFHLNSQRAGYQYNQNHDNYSGAPGHHTYHEMNGYNTLDMNVDSRQLLSANNSSLLSNNPRINSSYLEALQQEKNAQNEFNTISREGNDRSALMEQNLKAMHQPSELVRNYSMPVLNNPQSSLLQQHYQELTKLLAVNKDKPSIDTKKLTATTNGSSLNSSNTKNSTANSALSENNKKLKNKSKFRQKPISDNHQANNLNSNPPETQIPKPLSELGKSQSSINLQSHNNNRHSRKHDIDHNKYSSMKLEDLEGRLYSVCKDQYGCRYLQKQLEDGGEKQIEMIYNEITPHYSKLMVDPFGNYLCQKLFEYCNENQRTHIIKLISEDIVNISLNIHGTRASQKLIDLLTLQEQVDYIIEALKDSVVLLIRDLNGNHVIQKCLNKLINTPSGSNCKHNRNVQFIYDSVAKNCIEVATHRHGCCVFQRCIDVASTNQLKQLVQTVSENALSLVQDPFGNYVVQYILDLNSAEINEILISRFVPSYAKLSKQKFSSNVMEKCFKLSNQNMQSMIVASILQNHNQHQLMVLADLISDSFGNYVIQTILDFLVDQKVKLQLIDAIKMIQNNIKLTPYGKRIINKLYRDGFVSAVNSTVPSNNNSRISSPVLANPRIQMFTNQNQYSPGNFQLSMSTPNLLAQHQNNSSNMGMAYNNYLNINQGGNSILGTKMSPYMGYSTNMVNNLNIQPGMNQSLGLDSIAGPVICASMRGNVSLNGSMNTSTNKFKINNIE